MFFRRTLLATPARREKYLSWLKAEVSARASSQIFSFNKREGARNVGKFCEFIARECLVADAGAAVLNSHETANANNGALRESTEKKWKLKIYWMPHRPFKSNDRGGKICATNFSTFFLVRRYTFINLLRILLLAALCFAFVLTWQRAILPATLDVSFHPNS